MIDYNYITKKIKSKGFKLADVANTLGVQYQTLNKNLKNNSLDTIQKVSEVIGVSFFELLLPPEGFTHFYDEQDRWLGIVRKYPYSQEADSMQLKERFEQEQTKDGEE
ncbi:hypothetical protein HMPREF9075_00058 [Capnocytophaga sp. oral taxon 332 str. F0381]|uniref:helix-turn-helix domain-containing protein n=1 Tax=Capnocytophaga sp. oral taxon 332 TaxID=712213 RepID=UPI0002A214E6|nr:helix-turn-helix transcriptional regulator [Capnocytophaga sp. oral taxon 332]EKY13358.1 hypothetical protein HMPREF9075_00058 [Capnocytophaga sp. oral taxon 332 str. F0381]